jgi:hypothetical protein
VARPRRRRGSGSLGQLKARLWAVIEYTSALVEDGEPLPHDLRLRACNSLTQAAATYYKILEGAELQARVEALENRTREERTRGTQG